MNDRMLAEKAMAEEYNLTKVMQTGLSRETSKANPEAMQAKPTSRVNRIPQDESDEDTDMSMRLDSLQKEIESIRRLKRAGKYSARYPKEKSYTRDNSHKAAHNGCIKCTYDHDRNDKCPADGRKCHACDKEGHFKQSILCKAKSKNKNTRQVRYVYEESSDSEEEQIARISPAYSMNSPGRTWPGVEKGCQETADINYLQNKKVKNGRYVNVTMGSTKVTLFCDTGSRYTILPPDQYQDSMGDIVPAKCHLRAWGSEKYLDTKGMFYTTIESENGARVHTWVYVVGGTRPEPLLGDTDAENLGIIKFNPKGNVPTSQIKRIEPNRSIPDKLRQAGIKVRTEKPKYEEPTERERKRRNHEYSERIYGLCLHR